MKLCKDCKHFEAKQGLDDDLNPAIYYLCHATAVETINLVTGAKFKKPVPYCADMRYHGACGRVGKLFEEK